MKLRVKLDQTAYVHERRYRSGQIVDVPEKLLKKADKAYIDALEVQRTKELGAAEAKKHGLKPGDLILPKWAELPSKPLPPARGVPGSGKQPGAEAPPEGEESDSGEETGAGDGDAQKVL